MLFLQHVYIGLPWLGRRSRLRAPDQVLEPVDIRASSVDVAGDYAGSYHVLEMGRQYSDYARYAQQRPRYRYSPSLPSWSPAQRLQQRIRAADVTGNIGEIVAGIVARRTLGAKASQLAHLEVRQDGRTPDYLLVGAGGVRTYASGLTGIPEAGLPFHWPMEAKAWSGSHVDRDAIRDAVRQLAAYWLDTALDYPEGVGHGIVVGVRLGRPRTVNVHVLVPRDASALVTWLDSMWGVNGIALNRRQELQHELSGEGIMKITAHFRDRSG
jgi:hypothetical protein